MNENKVVFHWLIPGSWQHRGSGTNCWLLHFRTYQNTVFGVYVA